MLLYLIEGGIATLWFLAAFAIPGLLLFTYVQTRYLKQEISNLEFALYSAGFGIAYITIIGNIWNNTVGVNVLTMLITMFSPLIVLLNKEVKQNLISRIQTAYSSINKYIFIPASLVFFTCLYRFDLFVHKSLYSKDPWVMFRMVYDEIFFGGTISQIFDNILFRLGKIAAHKSLYGFFSLQSAKYLGAFWFIPIQNEYIIARIIYPICASVLVALVVYAISYRLFQKRSYAIFSSLLVISSIFVIDRQSLFHPETFSIFLMLLVILLFISSVKEKNYFVMSFLLLGSLLLHIPETIFIAVLFLAFFGIKAVFAPSKENFKSLLFPFAIFMLIPLMTFPEILVSTGTAIADPGFDWNFMLNFLLYAAFNPIAFALIIPGIILCFNEGKQSMVFISLAVLMALLFAVFPEGILPMFPYRYLIYLVPFAAILIPYALDTIIKACTSVHAKAIFTVLMILLLLPQTYFWYTDAIRTEPRFTKIAINPRYSDPAVDLFYEIKTDQKYNDTSILVSYFYKWLGWQFLPERKISYIDKFEDRYCPTQYCTERLNIVTIHEVLSTISDNNATLLITENMAPWARPSEPNWVAVEPLYSFAEQLESYGVFNEIERINTYWKTSERQIVVYEINSTLVDTYLEVLG